MKPLLTTKWKDAWILMRIPFSIYLMPVFWLSLAVLPLEKWNLTEAIICFLILHLLIYPASNGYNSLIDKDETSVGGLKNPPKAGVELHLLVLMFDVCGILLSFVHGLYFGFCVAVYWLMSRAYSSPKIRLKKMPFLSWFVVAVFQGGWTVLMVWSGLMQNWDWLSEPYQWIWIVTATFFLAGSYPITQIYQHKEDLQRGDQTISSLVGIKGTFYIASAGLFIGSIFLVCGFIFTKQSDGIVLLAATSIPTFYYFSKWMMMCLKDIQNADFEHTMLFNKISSIGLSSGLIFFMILKSWGISLLLQP